MQKINLRKLCAAVDHLLKLVGLLKLFFTPPLSPLGNLSIGSLSRNEFPKFDLGGPPLPLRGPLGARGSRSNLSS